MINQLRKVFKSFLIYTEGMSNLNPEYKWFSTDQQEIIGIHQDELTAKEAQVLAAFITPYNIEFPVLTDEEKKWKKLIHSADEHIAAEFKLDGPYRFVYFSIKKNQTNPTLFKDAIHDLFAKKVPILWENGHEGIIIEEQAQQEESISFEQIIDILMSDLYVKINFFVGPFKENLVEVNQYYQSIIDTAKIAAASSNKAVMTYIETVPYLLIEQMEESVRNDIGKTVLQEYIDDGETLKMIEAFVQCNLNISETSKVLHMHRNSLQYRLDRFYEKTGIDVRQFHQAMTVYLALLASK